VTPAPGAVTSGPEAPLDKPAYDPHTIVIGVLGKPHGVRGEIGLRLFNVESSSLTELDSITLERDGKREARVVERARPFASGLLITLAGITTREQAAALTNSHVRVARDVLPAPAPGEFFVSDVIGCDVVGVDGARLGVVRETFWNGAHDVMIVAGAGDAGTGGGAEHMIPLVPHFVRAVDAGGRTIQVSWQVEEQGEDEGDG